MASIRKSADIPSLLALALAIISPSEVWAVPSVVGTSGFINMPDARIGEQGTLNSGYSYFRPYSVIWDDLAFTPWLEGSFRYTRIAGVSGFGDSDYGKKYGAYKDKSFGAKLQILPEGTWNPAFSLGKTDLTGASEGTLLYNSKYAVASKRLGPLDLSLGYGTGRIHGAFGGVRLKPLDKLPLSLVAEYDANNYRHDIQADQSGANKKKKGLTYGLEYQWGWLGTQLSYQHNTVGVNAYISIPLDAREFVPKIDEPKPFLEPVPRPSLKQWQEDPAYRIKLVTALYREDFRSIRLKWQDGVLNVALTNRRISSMSRAVGRAARIVLAHMPEPTREIQITYTVNNLPAATYNFYNLDELQAYFWGMTPRSKLAQSITASLARPDAIPETEAEEALDAAAAASPESILRMGEDSNLVTLRSEDKNLNRFAIRPNASFFFNDPSGAIKYDTSLLGSVSRDFSHGWSAQATTQLGLFENVSDVTQPSNSNLPHVRTDVADYKRASRFKLNRLLLSNYFQLASGVYGRASAGIYEEMFAGTGTQFLYFPKSSPWAADIAVDWVKQRNTEGWFGMRDYSTVTAIGSIHYRLPDNLTATVRAGRFLAKDEGVRLELSKRYRSGFEVGAWYTATNGNDTTMPGSPTSPYRDKGIFITIPLSSMLTRDTQATGGFSLAPWTRDVGQMVASPGDLYSMFDKAIVRGLFNRDGLSGFGDVDDDYPTPLKGKTALNMPWGSLASKDANSFAKLATESDTWTKVAVAGGLIGISTLADGSIDRYSEKHLQGNRWKTISKLGDAVPYAGLLAGGLAAVSGTNDRLTLAGAASVEAGLTAVAASSGMKYLAGRERPTADDGSKSFEFGKSGDKYGSFPSRHTMVAWATLTPFAQAYDAPWLYGVAGMTNFSRVRSREHWLSDTVAGAAVGYALGSLTWSWRKQDGGLMPSNVMISPEGAVVQWKFK